MGRCIPHGSIVRVGPVRTIKRNDVVLARLPSGQIVLHRVVRQNAETVFLCGDRRVQLDPPIPRSDVVGVVEELLRNGRRWPIGDLPRPTLGIRLGRLRRAIRAKFLRRVAK
jgi:hypothetical protein